MAAADCTQACSVMECSGKVFCKGFCTKHYQRQRTHGDPGFTTRGLRVEKPCAWCGKVMSLKPATAKARTCCSRICGANQAARAKGHRPQALIECCAGCGKAGSRRVRSNKDAGKYCSKGCYDSLRMRVSSEKDALRRIRCNWLVKTAPEPKPDRSIVPCVMCGAQFHKPRFMWSHNAVCGDECREARTRKARDAWKATDKALSSRRACRARRRAKERGAEADRIDWLRVFERDKWRCHLCGCKTLKGRRGTLDPKAPELDHIVTLRDGGSHTWGNVACACRACNAAKGARSQGQVGLSFAA